MVWLRHKLRITNWLSLGESGWVCGDVQAGESRALRFEEDPSIQERTPAELGRDVKATLANPLFTLPISRTSAFVFSILGSVQNAENRIQARTKPPSLFVHKTRKSTGFSWPWLIWQFQSLQFTSTSTSRH